MAETSTFPALHINVIEVDGVKRFAFEHAVFDSFPARLIYPQSGGDAILMASRFIDGEHIPFDRSRLDTVREWIERTRAKT